MQRADWGWGGGWVGRFTVSSLLVRFLGSSTKSSSCTLPDAVLDTVDSALRLEPAQQTIKYGK